MRFLYTILLFCLSHWAFGQTEQESQLIYIEHSDETIIENDGGLQRKFLKGNVRMYQDSTFMFCDSAVIINNKLTAVGNVVIVQSDTISLFGDSLIYNGNNKKARVFDNVTLENGEQKLYTHRLNYDVGNRIATYRDTALMLNNTTKLQSKRGVYDVNKQLATFKEYVVVRDSAFNLRADSLKFNTGLNRAIFIAPTEIVSDSAQIYCTGGFYDFQQKNAKFLGDPQYINSKTEATADSILYDQISGEVRLMGQAYYKEDPKVANAEIIYYNEKSKSAELIGDGVFVNNETVVEGEHIKYDEETGNVNIEGKGIISDPPNIIEAESINYKEDGFGVLKGNVIWSDTSAQTRVICEHAIYNKEMEYVKAMSDINRPYMETVSEGDTMFLAADTLISYNEIEIDSLNIADTIKILKAYNDVKILKSDLQAIGDSLHYNDRDSLFTLFENPFVWSDSTQFSGDTIDLYLKNSTLDRIHAKGNGLILNQIASEYFNQIKGRDIEVFFAADTLDQMLVKGNAEAYYYMLDKLDAFIGVNTTICSKIHFKFAEKQIQDIRFYETPTSKMIPIQEVNPIALRLPNFFWNEQSKPLSLEEIIKWKVVEIKKEEPPSGLDSLGVKIDSTIKQKESIDDQKKQ